MYSRVVISSGHGKYVRGASGVLDEVDEARKVTNQIANELRFRGIDTVTYHDDTSKTQNDNLNRIVNFHNSKPRDLDISVHFNAYAKTAKPMGTEVLYVTQQALAANVSAAISLSGFINRGAKKRTDLFFLNHTAKPAILLEICFVDSSADADLYKKNFESICINIANVLGGECAAPAPTPTPPAGTLFEATGKCSYFGGPEDTGVSASEGLAFIFSVDDAPQLFLPYQPEGTTGLARRLNPFVSYVACRWDYKVTPKNTLSDHMALVSATKTGIAIKAFPADWGPHESTGRIADLSPALMDALGIETDDEVTVIYPYEED
jgi:N-acetylmuramoyl-L-alanine amidase